MPDSRRGRIKLELTRASGNLEWAFKHVTFAMSIVLDFINEASINNTQLSEEHLALANQLDLISDGLELIQKTIDELEKSI